MQSNTISPIIHNSSVLSHIASLFFLLPFMHLSFLLSIHLGSASGEFSQPGLFCQRGRFGPGSGWMLPPALQTSRCGAAWQCRACSAGRSDGDSKTPLMSLQRGQDGHAGRAEQTNLSSSLTQQEVGIHMHIHTHITLKKP